MKDLVTNFYNDSLFMDQNACSSPHLVLWYSKNKNKKQQKKKQFWSLLSEHIFKHYKTDDEIFIENILNTVKI